MIAAWTCSGPAHHPIRHTKLQDISNIAEVSLHISCRESHNSMMESRKLLLERIEKMEATLNEKNATLEKRLLETDDQLKGDKSLADMIVLIQWFYVVINYDNSLLLTNISLNFQLF